MFGPLPAHPNLGCRIVTQGAQAQLETASLLAAQIGTTRFIKRDLCKPADLSARPAKPSTRDRAAAHARSSKKGAGADVLTPVAVAQARTRKPAAAGAADDGVPPAAAGAMGALSAAAGGAGPAPMAVDGGGPGGALPAGAAAHADGGAPAAAAASPPITCWEGAELVLPAAETPGSGDGVGVKWQNVDVLLPGALLLHPLTMTEWSGLTCLASLVKRLQAVLAVHEWHQVVMPHTRCVAALRGTPCVAWLAAVGRLCVRSKGDEAADSGRRCHASVLQRTSSCACRPELRLPPLRDAIVCFTPRSVNDSFNYEGAELLGDAVLDYLAAAYLFHALP